MTLVTMAFVEAELCVVVFVLLIVISQKGEMFRQHSLEKAAMTLQLVKLQSELIRETVVLR